MLAETAQIEKAQIETVLADTELADSERSNSVLQFGGLNHYAEALVTTIPRRDTFFTLARSSS